MKSIVLSLTIVFGLGFFFMSVFDKKLNSLYNNIPDWAFIALMTLCFVGLLLSLYWGVTGLIKGQRLLNLLGIFCSVFGLGIFVLGYVMENGRGQEKAGQFDHQLSLVETRQRQTLYQLMKQTNTDPADVQLVAYWKMKDNPGKFVVCVQKGNVVALQIKNSPLNDISDINFLDKLNWLILENCQLQSISGLSLPVLQRLSVKNNQLTSLHGIEGSPDLTLIDYSANPIKDSSEVKAVSDKNLYAH